MKLFYLPLCLFLTLLLPACVNEECDEDALPDPVLNVAFKKYTDATRSVQKSADTLVNLTMAYAKGLNDQPLPFYVPGAADARVKNVTLHLSPSADSTIFYLESPGADGKTIAQSFTVTYTQQPKFISQACGYELRYSNIAVTKPYTDFDDIVVIVPEINPIRNEIHIQLYFKP